LTLGFEYVSGAWKFHATTGACKLGPTGAWVYALAVMAIVPSMSIAAVKVIVNFLMSFSSSLSSSFR
jgi:hypothetical protein